MKLLYIQKTASIVINSSMGVRVKNFVILFVDKSIISN